MNHGVKLHQSSNFYLQIFKGIVQRRQELVHNYKSIDLPLRLSSLKFHLNPAQASICKRPLSMTRQPTVVFKWKTNVLKKTLSGIILIHSYCVRY
jgi:hypothetical protein